jgi:hypothetical protein
MRIRESLVCSVLAATIASSAAQADTAIATKWRPLQLGQTDCMSYARLAIFRAGFEKADPGSQTMSGKKGDYTASVRCLSEQRLVFFVTAGPSPQTASDYLDVVFGQFGKM